MEDKELEGLVQQLMDEGADDAYIDEVIAEWDNTKVLGPGDELDFGDKPVIGDGDYDPGVEGEDYFLEDVEEPNANYIEPTYKGAPKEDKEKTAEEAEQERAIKEELYRYSHGIGNPLGGVVGLLPDFLLEPYAAFESTLLGFGGGIADAAVQQYARFDETKYAQDEEGRLVESEGSGQTISQILETYSGKERAALWDQYSNAGDLFRDVVEGSQFAEQAGSGSISTELAEGNIGNAAQLTANQTASGLASLVPFMVPGGQIVGPVVLGASVVGSSFEEDIEAQGDAAINDIYNASYAKGGVELASEFVTAGIIGRAKKFASGGASEKLVRQFTEKAYKRILGDAASEGLSEGAADFGSRVVDSIFYGKEIDAREAAVGFIDASIVGAIVGGGVTTSSGFLNPEASAKQKKQLETVIASTLAPKKNKEAVQQNAKVIAAAKVTESQSDPNTIIGKAKIEAAQAEAKEATDNILNIQKLEQEAMDNMGIDVLGIQAKNKDQIAKLQETIKVAKSRGQDLEAEILTDRIAKLEKEIDVAWEKAAYQKEVEAEFSEKRNDLTEAIEESDATIEQIQLSDNGMTKQNKLTLKKARQRKAANQKKLKDLTAYHAKEYPQTGPQVVTKAKALASEARKAAKAEGKDKAYSNLVATEAANKHLIKAIQDPKASESTRRAAENEFLKNNAALIKKTEIDVGKFKLESLTREDIKSIAQQELLRKAKAFKFVGDSKVGAYLSSSLYNKVANTTLNKDGKSRLKEELTTQEQEEIQDLKDIGLDPTQEANEIANVKSKYKVLFTSLEQGGLSGDSVTEALNQQIVESAGETYRSKGSDTEVDIAGDTSGPSEAIRKLLNKAYGITNDNILSIKNSILEGLKSGDIILPSGANQGVFLESLRGNVNKTLKDKILDFVGSNQQEFLDKALTKTELMFALLPSSAKAGTSFAGLFANGNPTIEQWENHFGIKGRTGRKRRARLVESLAENVLDQYVDDVIEEYPDFSEKYFPANSPKTVLQAAVDLVSARFTDVKIDTTLAGLKARLEKIGKLEYWDKINGMVSGGTVYISPLATSGTETLIHEFGHVWVQELVYSNPELYARGAELLRDSQTWIDLKLKSLDPDSLYYNYSDAKLMEEAMATAIGKKGATVFEKNSEQGNKWINWLNTFGNYIKGKLGIDLKENLETLTTSEFLNIAVSEILGGRFTAAGRPLITEFQTKAGETAGSKKIVKEGLDQENVTLDNKEFFNESIDFVLSFPADMQARALSSLNMRSHLGKGKEFQPGFKTGLNDINLWRNLAKENPRYKNLQEIVKQEYYKDKYLPGKERLSRKEFHNVFKKLLAQPNAEYNNNIKFFRSLGMALANIKSPEVRNQIHQLLSDSNDTGARADAKNIAEQKGDGKKIKEHVLPFNQFLKNITGDPNNSAELLKDFVQIDLLKTQDDLVTAAGLKNTMPVDGVKYGNVTETRTKLEEAGLPGSLIRYFNKAVHLDPDSIVMNDGRTLGEKAPFLREGVQERTEFSEKTTPRTNKEHKNLVEIVERQLSLNGYTYKGNAKYKRSRISGKAREAIAQARQEFLENKDGFTTSELLAIHRNVDQIIRDGLIDQRAKNKERTNERVKTKEEAKELIEEVFDIDTDNLTPAGIDTLNKNRSTFISELKSGKIGKAISRILAPSWNNDFYGLIYSLLPQGKNREAARKLLKEKLTDPLEKAELEHLTRKQKAMGDYLNLVKAVGQDTLNADSGIDIDGYPLSNSQVVKIYNYLKDPRTYDQLSKGGVTDAKMLQVVQYIQANPALGVFGDGVTDIYAGFQADLNAKLDQHGYPIVTAPSIERSKLGPARTAIVDAILGPTATVGAYSPLTATGQDEGIDLDDALNPGSKGNLGSVMAGNLVQRTGGGKYNPVDSNVYSDFNKYLDGPVRTMSFLDFADGASAFFNPKSMEALTASLGKSWVDAMKDSLKRTVTGKNEQTRSTPGSRAVSKWMNYTIGGIMFVNTRSAILQLLSTINYRIEDPTVSALGRKAPKELKKKMNDRIRNSAWIKNRAQGKTDVALDDLFNHNGNENQYEKWLAKQIKAGYFLTKLGDRAAIVWGGVPWATGRAVELMEDGLTEDQAIEQAYAEFVAKAEESQQSARPSRLGKEQTTKFGKVFLAFQNTPMQYARKVSRALQDLSAPGTSPKRRKKARRELIYYGGMAPTLFASLQGFIGSALFLEDDDEKAETEIVNLMLSFIHTNLSGAGALGVLASSLIEAVTKAVQTGDLTGKDAVNILINSSPAVGTKARQVKQAADGKYPASSISDALGNDEYKLLTQGLSAGDLAGLPATRALYLLEQVSDGLTMIGNGYTGLGALRLAGWSGYSLGLKNQKVGKTTKVDSALRRGEAGQAFKDGTIEVDPNLSPEEKAKTIAHEEQHVKDMKEHGLDYDDNNVMWDGKKYPRKDGMISIDGGFKKEGDPSLPWEQSAYEAESPLKANGGGKKKKTIEEHDKEADEFTTNWYNDKNTRSRLKDQTGLSDEEIDHRIAAATNTDTSYNAFLEAGDAEYNSPGRGFDADGNYSVIPEGEPGHYPSNIQVAVDLNNPSSKGILPHEQTHALEFDNQLGLKAQEILGPASEDEYLNNPGETYGNLQEFRSILKLEPWERDLTPERLQNLIEFQEVGKNEDVQQMLRNYDIKKLTKALNKIAQKDREVENKGIAYEKPKKKLSDLYI